MKISGYQKLTLTDYPNHLAAIIFTQGCNYRCPFCQNSSLLNYEDGLIDENEVLDNLKNRKKVLEGVVISGGEPTIQKDLKSFIKKVRELGFEIKLDTNGSNSKMLKELIDEKLIDYVAMDIKSMPKYYDKITGAKVIMNEIVNSIEILKNSGIAYELRTTIVKEFHDLEIIKDLCQRFSYTNYYLQNYNDSENVLTKGLHGFNDDEIKEILNMLKEYPNAHVRGY